jgi:cell division protein FtsB
LKSCTKEMHTTSRLTLLLLMSLLWLLMLPLLVNTMFGRTKMAVRREMNNAAAENLRNPTAANKKKLEKLRQEYNSFGKKKK